MTERLHTVAIIAAAAAMLLTVLVDGAFPAWDGAASDSPFAPWFESLRARDGASCCSVADCRPREYRTGPAGYEVRDGDEWLPVPPEAVLPRDDNPLGKPVACVFQGRVLCFVRAAEV